MTDRTTFPGSTFWDERFQADAYAYGTEPNHWLVSCAGAFAPCGRVLSLGEGEGRNAAWLAGRGFAVEAVDGSAAGLEKARRLAAARGVSFESRLANLAAWTPPAGAYDAVVLVYLHLPPAVRAAVHAGAALALRSGGVLVLEAFAPAQLGRGSGPREAELLYAADTLRGDFPGLAWEVLEDVEVDRDEGAFHRGRAAVVRGLGRRV